MLYYCVQTISARPYVFLLFFFNDTATTEIYTLSLHDALPIYRCLASLPTVRSAIHQNAKSSSSRATRPAARPSRAATAPDRKSTRLNSSHANISYAVFCLKKKKKKDLTNGTLRA